MAFLTVLEGTLKGHKVVLEHPLTRVGRREENDWVLQDASVSGTHCEIEKSDTGFLLRDLGSTNGTKVNNEPVKQKQLFRNDIIHIGEIALMLEGEDVPQTSQVDLAAIPRTTIIIPQKRPTETPKIFVRKTNSNRIWIAVITVLVLVIIAMLVLFFQRS